MGNFPRHLFSVGRREAAEASARRFQGDAGLPPKRMEFDMEWLSRRSSELSRQLLIDEGDQDTEERVRNSSSTNISRALRPPDYHTLSHICYY